MGPGESLVSATKRNSGEAASTSLFATQSCAGSKELSLRSLVQNITALVSGDAFPVSPQTTVVGFAVLAAGIVGVMRVRSGRQTPLVYHLFGLSKVALDKIAVFSHILERKSRECLGAAIGALGLDAYLPHSRSKPDHEFNIDASSAKVDPPEENRAGENDASGDTDKGNDSKSAEQVSSALNSDVASVENASGADESHPQEEQVNHAKPAVPLFSYVLENIQGISSTWIFVSKQPAASPTSSRGALVDDVSSTTASSEKVEAELHSEEDCESESSVQLDMEEEILEEEEAGGEEEEKDTVGDVAGNEESDRDSAMENKENSYSVTTWLKNWSKPRLADKMPLGENTGKE